MSLSDTITTARYCLPGETSWEQVVNRCQAVWSAVPAPKSLRDEFRHLMAQKKLVPGGRILRNAGLPRHQLSNCFLFNVEDSREGWGELTQKATVSLMTGGGVGVDYGNLRPSGAVLGSTIGVASGPIPLIRTVNEIGRGVQCGGFRRSALYASLPWYHPDIFQFIHMKDWPQWLRDQKARDMDVAAPGDMTNISVRLDAAFFEAYRAGDSRALAVYREAVESMLRTGEPGFQVDFDNQILRNACTEIISADDSDSCVLAALNFARLEDEEEVRVAAQVGTAFLLAVTEYNHSPTMKAADVQRRNRRLGLGVMGVGEWFIQRELMYGDGSIFPWLAMYKQASEVAADDYSWLWSFPRPVAVRAVAPTGTISILAETTSGLEPLFAPAYERRYLTPTGFACEVLVDPIAARYWDAGIGITECAYNIDYERRVRFQHEVQRYVDNGISSTVNLPDTEQDPVKFGEMLMHYLPGLRGITVFPNGSRGMQPITPVDFQYALSHRTRFEYTDAACPSGVCSI